MLLKKFPHVESLFIVGLIGLVAVAVVCLMPISSSGYPIFKGVDKIEHLLTYLCLSYYFVQLTLKKTHLFIAFFLFLFGVAIEFLQEISGYRFFDVWDMLANTIGVFLGYLLAHKNDYVLFKYFTYKYMSSDDSKS